VTKVARGYSHRTTLTAESVSEFAGIVAKVRREWFDEEDHWGPWFRGQQRASWSLIPKLFREYGSAQRIRTDGLEDEICEEFATRAPVLSGAGALGGNPWEWYFLMQHFGAPTRLLDWTGGALIALYFAVRDNPGFYNAAVWALDPFELNRRVTGRDYLVSPNQPEVNLRNMREVAPWLPQRFGRHARVPRQPIAVYPAQVVQRMSTQQSCFTVHGSDLSGLDRLQGLKEPLLVKIVIPSFRVREIKKELETSGIDEAVIFPDLDGLGRTVCARWKFDSPAPPHMNVHTRLQPSNVHKGAVGVFAITKIAKGTRLFLGDNEEILWVKEESFSRQPTHVRTLYEDFAVRRGQRFGCPITFNRLTMAWYLNEPNRGQTPNVGRVDETQGFVALRDIRSGEELTLHHPLRK
jgi:hypothetical protein